MRKSGLSVILTCINMLLLVVGILISIFGALTLWSTQVVYYLLADPISYLRYHVDPNNARYGISVPYVFMEMSKPFNEVIFVAGIITVCVSVIGLWSLNSNKLCPIVFYLFVLGAVVMAHIGSIIYYFCHQQLVTNYADQVLFKLVSQYTSLSIESGTSIPLAMIMMNLGCCGYEDGNDFQNSYNFHKTEKFDGKSYQNLLYPIACCKLSHNFKKFTSKCPNEFTSFTSNVDTGCKIPFMDKALTLVNMSVYISLIIMLLNVVAIVLISVKVVELVKYVPSDNHKMSNKSYNHHKNHYEREKYSDRNNDKEENYDE